MILGILNITADSFSDGGRFLDPQAALAQAHALVTGGADVIDLGAAASNPAAQAVSPDVEIARLQPVVAALKGEGIAISIDSFQPATQAWALDQGVDYLNDIQGFPDASLYPRLAASEARLIVMHSVQGRGRADRRDVPPAEILSRVTAFFEVRVAALEGAGIARERLILDPGMGFFLGTDPACSFAVLRALPRLKAHFGLPVLVSVSRKSFLRAVTGASPAEAGAGTLAAELFAAGQGADFIRTHDARAFRDALTVWRHCLEAATDPGLRGDRLFRDRH